MRVEITHKACGGLVGYFTGDKDDPVAKSKDVELLDGTHPGDIKDWICPKCKKIIRGTVELVRHFE